MLRLSFSDERVLAVTGHPGDAELLCAGTLARSKQDGAQIAICVMCEGDKGLPAGPVPEKSRRAGVRGAGGGVSVVPGLQKDRRVVRSNIILSDAASPQPAMHALRMIF